MKSFGYVATALLVLFVSNAFAVELYKCEFNVVKKDNKHEWTKFFYLSSDRYISADFSGFDTKLDIKVDRAKGSLNGWVNGQRNFILRGDFNEGYFESWAATGTIKCQPKRDYEAAFMFKPWNNIFIQGDMSTIVNFHSPRDFVNGCFLGSADVALKTLQNAFKVDDTRSGVTNPLSLFVINLEKRCLKWEGYRDDRECIKWDIERPYTYELHHCDDDPNADPRS